MKNKHNCSSWFVSGESTQGLCEGLLKGRTFWEVTQYGPAYLQLSVEASTKFFTHVLRIVAKEKGDLQRVNVERPMTFPRWRYEST